MWKGLALIYIRKFVDVFSGTNGGSKKGSVLDIKNNRVLCDKSSVLIEQLQLTKSCAINNGE